MVSQLMMNSSLMQQKSQQQNSSFGSSTIQRQDNGLGFMDIEANILGSGQAMLSSLAHGADAGRNILNPFMTNSQRLVTSGSRFLGRSSRLANLADVGTTAGRNLSTVGRGFGLLGMDLSGINLASGIMSHNNSQILQSGADLGVATMGTFGGPLSSAFSGGYAAGQLLDQAVGGATGRSLSDRGGDALYDTFGTAPQWMMDMF